MEAVRHSLGHFADIVRKNERDGYLTVGLLATCPSMPGLVAGLQHSGPTLEPIQIGMLWLEPTGLQHSGNDPQRVARRHAGRGRYRRALQVMPPIHAQPPLSDRHIVMAGVRLTDPLEQRISINRESSSSGSTTCAHPPAVWTQLDRLKRVTDKI